MAQPDLTNLALNKKATQSSNFFPSAGLADKAVDGEVDGNWANGSVTHTTAETNPWWQVDLGGIFTVTKIQIWNRTDAGQERLDNLIIWVRRSTRDNWEAFSQGMHKFKQNETYPLTFENNKQVRYVKVQLLGNNAILHLAEVKVFEAPSEDDDWDAIKNSQRSEDFQSYLDKYPSGKFAGIARFNIKKFGGPTTPISTADPVEEQFWKLVKDSNNPSDFQAYLKEYPSGKYAVIARFKANPPPKPTPKPTPIATPTPNPTPTVILTPQPTPTPKPKVSAEDEIWNLIKDSKRAGDFDVYLKDYPSGKYSTMARLKKSRLTPKKEDPPPKKDDEDKDNLTACSVVTKGDNLNVRSYGGKIIGRLSNGSIVYINDVEGNRTNVSEKRRGKYVVLGWVSSNFLECDRF
jgi:hypothetical protein